MSRLLAVLYAEPDPLLDVVTRGRMARADRFALRIPDAYADSVRWRRRRAGRIDGIHPAFLVLGGTAALVYQVLDGTEARGAEVARAARLSPSATSAALRMLAEHGLAERGRGGWRRGERPPGRCRRGRPEPPTCSENERPGISRTGRGGGPGSGSSQAAAAPTCKRADGWWSLDDPDEYDFMSCRWPMLATTLSAVRRATVQLTTPTTAGLPGNTPPCLAAGHRAGLSGNRGAAPASAECQSLALWCR